MCKGKIWYFEEYFISWNEHFKIILQTCVKAVKMLRYHTKRGRKNKDAKYAKSLEWLMVSLLFMVSLSFTGNLWGQSVQDYISYCLDKWISFVHEIHDKTHEMLKSEWCQEFRVIIRDNCFPLMK
jgi:hypothetical protein